MYKFSIVFSGGGVRGVAHLGVLKALEEFGFKPDAVSGASAGAVAAAFYAGGYSAEESLEFLRNTPFYTSWGNFSYKKPGLLDTENFLQYFDSFFPDNSFEALHIPCFISTTDLIGARCKIFSSGELIHRILASCAYPFVFAPVKMDGSLYSDGGITNNFPIEPLESKSDLILGIYVNPLKEMDLNDFSSSWKVSERAIILRSYLQSKPKFERCHMFMMPKELSQFNIFDKRRMDKIFQIGYENGLKLAEKFAHRLQATNTQL